MKISGVMPLRNAVQLGYPFELAIRSLRPLCDEVVVLVDPTSEDDTLARVRTLSPDVLVESAWDMTNHDGRASEIAKQTEKVCAAASGDWIFSLQADELLHEQDITTLRECVTLAERQGVSGIEMTRLYFFGGLTRYRSNWTVPLLRLHRRHFWVPDPCSGAMQFIPATSGERKVALVDVFIYHYSRVGDSEMVARRVRNLDLFYHASGDVAAADAVLDYEFSLRKLDTYVVGHAAEVDGDAALLPFSIERHPAGVREYFHQAARRA